MPHAQVVWTLCQRQADFHGVSEAEFFAMLDRATLDRAALALLGAGLVVCGDDQSRELLGRLPETFAALKTVFEAEGTD